MISRVIVGFQLNGIVLMSGLSGSRTFETLKGEQMPELVTYRG